VKIQSTGEAARANPTQHQIKGSGKGYILVGNEPAIPAGIKSLPPVLPRPGSMPGTLHRLNNSGGSQTILRWDGMRWWHPTSPTMGNRMAWTPAHLGKAGWSYDKAV
jgi:hypothetical protein